MKKIPMLERFAAQSLVEYEGELIFSKEKFAELLIQQCMACSTWVGKMNTNLVEPVHTAHAINQRIKQQFGVEE
jgi:hypothetical protein